MPFLGNTPSQGFTNSVTKDDFNPNGSTTAFTLSKASNTNNIEVYVGNVRQEPTSSYSVSGTTLTMTEAPATGTNFYVMHESGSSAISLTPAAGTSVPGAFSVSGALTTAGFTSTGIDDNATSTAITIDASEKVGIGSSSPVRQLEIKDDGTHGQAIVGIIADAGDAAGIFMGTTSNNNAGGIRYFTDTNKLTLRANDEDRLLIDSAGIVTKPYQPAFGANATTTNIPITTQTTVTLNERFDVGGNLASNVFTAPVTGKYLITYMFYFSKVDSAHTTLDVTLVTSLKVYQQTFKPSVILSADGNFSVSSSSVCDMDAGDTAYIRVYVATGTAQTDIHGDSTASCYLLG